MRGAGAGLRVFKGPEALWELEKSPPFPENTELLFSSEAFEN